MLDVQKIIEMFDLKPLPHEGGFYRETYRSNEGVLKKDLPKRYSTNRNYGTAIYYLLTPETRSLMHKVASDELFHFYLGDPVEMLQLFADSTGKVCTLGSDILAGNHIQIVVPRGVWQGMTLKEGSKFALMGTTVAPGFDFDDFELGTRDKLLEQYPDFRDQIINLTK